MAEPACVTCGSAEIRTLPAVVSDGTWSGSSSSSRSGIAISSGGNMAVGFGGGSTTHGGATALAQALAPPPRPRADDTALAQKLFGAIVGVITLLLWGGTDLGLWLCIPALVAATSFALGVRTSRMDGVRIRAATELWNDMASRWQQLWYCPKCHTVSDLEARRAAPAQNYRSELL